MRITPLTYVELETLVGLETFAVDEVSQRLSATLRPLRGGGAARPGRLAFALRTRTPALRSLHALRSVVATHVVESFDVPRPRALLGQAHFSRIVDLVASIVSAHPRGTFETLRVSAAGAESSVLTRFKNELSEAFGLSVTNVGGDLLVALRHGVGWEVLVRTSPRPLSAREWRVCDFPGALNATAAHAMARLSRPVADETFVNVACGSGTLLVERLALGAPPRAALGYDVDEPTLDCARANLDASGYARHVSVERRDARTLPQADGSVRSVVADLPYAMLVGSAEANVELYPALLREAARVLEPGGRLVLVTTQTRLLERVAAALGDVLRVERVVRFSVPRERAAINPRVWVLERL
jgi:tRNA (guanine6-N2)-methyltransferase